MAGIEEYKPNDQVPQQQYITRDQAVELINGLIESHDRFVDVGSGRSTVRESEILTGGAEFGDASDGNVTVSTSVTLGSDMFYDKLVIENGGILDPNGYRIAANQIYIKQGGTLKTDGNAGGNASVGANASGLTPGAGGAGGAAGTARAAGSILGSVAGKAGGAGGAGGAVGSTGTVGTDGTGGNAATLSIGVNGVAGAIGGTSGRSNTNAGTVAGGAAGTAGSATGGVLNQPKGPTAAWLLFDITPSVALFKSSAGSGSSGGGGGGTGAAAGGGTGGGGGGGGGSGSAGGIMVLFAKEIRNEGTISSNGGAGGNGANGGNGSDGASGGGGGGGGGAAGSGGPGGVVILCYSTFIGNEPVVTGGAVGSIGSGGSPGAVDSSTAGAAGAAGTTGTTGSVIKIKNIS